jgi:arabinan endo-1,5-alpha-L-arabinosidase
MKLRVSNRSREPSDDVADRSQPKRRRSTYIAAGAAVVCGGILAGLVLWPNLHGGYTNPVLNHDAPDPSIIRGQDGFFYVYTTQSDWPTLKHIPMLRSSDLIHWTFEGDALPNLPRWVTTDVWAPHIVRIQDRYALYFAARQFGTAGFAIGVATSDSPTGPFDGEREPLVSGRGFVAIDPFVLTTPDGQNLLYWGSDGAPIRVQRLSSDGLSVRGRARPVLYPSRREYEGLIEAPWIIHHDDFYYLMYSGDACCEPDPHYAVLVARSESPFGPFVRLGRPILEANDDFLGPGHNATIRDASGQEWIVYHAFDRNDITAQRHLLIDPIKWVDGWPQVNDGKGPSTTSTEVPQAFSTEEAIRRLVGSGESG